MNSIIVDTLEKLAALSSALAQATLISFDTETTSTDPMTASLVGISLALDTTTGYYIPVGHDQGEQLSLTLVIDTLREPLTAPSVAKIAHNAKYDFQILARYGLRVSPLSFDTMIAEWLCDPNSHNLGLKNLAFVREGIVMTRITDLIGTGKNQITMAQVPIEKAAPYAVADAVVTLQLLPRLFTALHDRKVWKVFQFIEMPLIAVLAEMELTGITVSREFLASMSGFLTERMDVIQATINTTVGRAVNLNAPADLSAALFGTLKITPPEGTQKLKSGFYSTAAPALSVVAHQHPIIADVQEYREVSKLRSTYVDALPTQINGTTGRIHTTYNQVGSVTGRLSSSGPNLQNIPVRTELGNRVRKAFIAPPGWELLAVDYSQIELRIVAHMADDAAMIAAFLAGQDIHAATAAAVFGVPLVEVTQQQRRHAKAINFGLLYGMGPWGIVYQTGMTIQEAEFFFDSYFKTFPGVKRYFDGTKRSAAKLGYVETLFGRRRYFPELLNKDLDFKLRGTLEREAINAPIQGTAADIVKLAMLGVQSAVTLNGLQGRVLLQVHDELVIECPSEELEETFRIVKPVMESAAKLKVPLIVDAKRGFNWGELFPFK